MQVELSQGALSLRSDVLSSIKILACQGLSMGWGWQAGETARRELEKPVQVCIIHTLSNFLLHGDVTVLLFYSRYRS